MYLIVGLGNPEPEYSNTRHNMGFDVINKLSEVSGIKVEKNKFSGLYGQGELFGEKIILLKPQTYMNNSGESVIKAKNFFKVSDEKTIIVYDDVDIETGQIRIRIKGSAATHNGMKSVIQHMSTQEFPRVRVGIGTPDKDIVSYVLEKIPLKIRIEQDKGIEKATIAIKEIIENGATSAMNKFN